MKSEDNPHVTGTKEAIAKCPLRVNSLVLIFSRVSKLLSFFPQVHSPKFTQTYLFSLIYQPHPLNVIQSTPSSPPYLVNFIQSTLFGQRHPVSLIYSTPLTQPLQVNLAQSTSSSLPHQVSLIYQPRSINLAHLAYSINFTEEREGQGRKERTIKEHKKRKRGECFVQFSFSPWILMRLHSKGYRKRYKKIRENYACSTLFPVEF